jgi:FkbM family methyltransferase
VFKARHISAALNGLGIPQDHPTRRQVNDWIRNRRAIRETRNAVPSESFSQCAEDVIASTLIDTGLGRYIDIGSGHPVQGSNTYALYRQGWSGLLVDPLRSNINLAQRVRPRDTCVESLCSTTDKPAIDFFEYETYEYSTASPQRVAELTRRGHHVHATYKLPTFSLETLVRENDLFDARLLSIDVEGLELEVLEGNRWDTFRPELVIVEEWESPPAENTPIRGFMADLGYQFVSFNRASSFFLANL